MEANVILAKCSKHNRTFGIRVEKRGNDWVRTWAFSIDDAIAKREGFDKTIINGSLVAVDRYPGCPYCGNYLVVKCGCGKVSCYNESYKSEKQSDNKNEESVLRCHWCDTIMKNVVIVESLTVQSGDF